MTEGTEAIQKVALVTGASRGIGAEIAVELARRGHFVVVNFATSPADASEIVDRIKADGGNAFPIQADVSKSRDRVDLVQRTLDHFGRLDVLVNNAGIVRDDFLVRLSDDDIDLVIQTNLVAAIALSREAFKALRKTTGCIVNISSVVGKVGNPCQANYAAAKAGLIGFTRAAAKEAGKKGIRVNAVAPGFIDTDMTSSLDDKIRDAIKASVPLGRFGTVQDVAEAVAYLVSADYVNGEVLTVDGGMTCC